MTRNSHRTSPLGIVLEDQPDWTTGTVEVVEAPDQESQREYASAPHM